jgi:hypothetical protein
LDADPDRLAQAVLNLVDSAQVHTPPDTRIEVRAVAASDHVAIEVADDLPGIPETIREQVFDPFVRGDTPGATGLGLAVARAVVSAHGGTIEFDTGPAGTRMRLVLPWSGTLDAWAPGDGWQRRRVDDRAAGGRGGPSRVGAVGHHGRVGVLHRVRRRRRLALDRDDVEQQQHLVDHHLVVQQLVVQQLVVQQLVGGQLVTGAGPGAAVHDTGRGRLARFGRQR